MSKASADTEADVHGPTDDLAGETVRGVSWTAGAQLARQVLQTGSSIVIARLLLPEDFGQVAQIVVLAGLANILSEFGLGAALIQRQSIDERHRSTVFWTQASIGLVVSGIIAAAAPLIAAFYGDTDLRMLTILLAPNFFLSSLSTVQRALLTRAMRFRALAVVDISAVGVAALVCVVAAALGAGVHSLVAQMLTATAVTSVLLWVSASWRPRSGFDRAALGELLPFSRNLLGFTLVNYSIRNSDNLLVGRLMGATALGLYTRGYSILLYPTRQISAVVGKVMFASLSKLNDDVDRLRRAYLRAVSVIALVTFPLMVGLALVSEEFVLAVLGERWSAAIPIIRIFCVLGALESVFTTVGWLYQATGRTDILFRWGLVAGGVPLAGIAIGSAIGTIEAVTVAYAVSTALLAYPAVRIAGRLIGMTFSDLVRVLAPNVWCTMFMAVVVLAVGRVLPDSLGPVISLGAKGAVGGIAYLAVVHFANIAAYRDLRDVLPRAVGRTPA